MSYPSSPVTSPNAADFDDFLLKRLDEDEDDELENLLNDDDEGLLKKYANAENEEQLQGASEEANDDDIEVPIETVKETARQTVDAKQESTTETASSSADVSSQQQQRSRRNSSISSQGGTVTLEWDPNDDQDDQNDSSFKNFHNKLLSVLQHNGASLNMERLKQLTSAVVPKSKQTKEESATEQPKTTPPTFSGSQGDRVNEIVETRLSLFISNILNQFGKVITIPNPDDLLNRQEEALNSTPFFSSIKPSLQRKLILLECTVDNMADTLAECVRKNVRLGKQRALLRQNAKDLKLQFLQQQKDIQNKDQEISYLHEKISKLNQLATKYKTRLEEHGEIEHADEDLHLLASTEAQPTAGAKLVSSFMSWIGKKDGQPEVEGSKSEATTRDGTATQPRNPAEPESSAKTEADTRSTWGSWFSKKS